MPCIWDGPSSSWNQLGHALDPKFLNARPVFGVRAPGAMKEFELRCIHGPAAAQEVGNFKPGRGLTLAALFP